MALKALLLRKKIDQLKKAAEAMEPKLEALRTRSAEFETRAAELEAAVNEITEETPEADRQVVTEEVDAFDQERSEHEEEAKKAEEEKEDLEKQIRETEAELEELEKKQEEKPAEKEPEPEPEEEKPEEKRRGDYTNMKVRSVFDKMSIQERTALVNNENIKAWLGEYRSAMKEKRAISNVGLTIPTEILPLFRENIERWSKLYNHVNVIAVAGEARQPIMGTIPEAVWTECCANLNELDLAFNDWTMDCYKVGGYFVLCKANVEDSDIDLLAAIVEALGQAIGKAVDKAILYGRNTDANQNMPLGVVTRLLQTSQPAGYPSTARAWADLHTSHVKSEGTAVSPITGLDLIKALIADSAIASSNYSRGELLWIANEKTYKNIVAQSLNVNAAGAVVAGIEGRMPVVGGDIEVLNFVPDDVIIFGYFDLYTLAERAGREFASSEHVRFIQDQIVYKGTARYDGAPIIAEGFGIIALNGASVAATDATFPQDEANSAQGLVLNKSSVSVAVSGKVQLHATTIPEGQAVTWTSADTSKATVSTAGLVTGVASTSAVVITAASGNANAFCTVAVTES